MFGASGAQPLPTLLAICMVSGQDSLAVARFLLLAMPLPIGNSVCSLSHETRLPLFHRFRRTYTGLSLLFRRALSSSLFGIIHTGNILNYWPDMKEIRITICLS